VALTANIQACDRARRLPSCSRTYFYVAAGIGCWPFRHVLERRTLQINNCGDEAVLDQRAMTLRDKLLYHHAYPAKLIVDFTCALVAMWLCWNQHLIRAAVVGLGPPALASVAVVRFVDLDRVKNSPVGRYVGRHMSLTLHNTAVAGVVIAWLAALRHSIFYCAVGLLIVTFAWVRGPLRKSGAARRRTRG